MPPARLPGRQLRRLPRRVPERWIAAGAVLAAAAAVAYAALQRRRAHRWARRQLAALTLVHQLRRDLAAERARNAALLLRLGREIERCEQMQEIAEQAALLARLGALAG